MKYLIRQDSQNKELFEKNYESCSQVHTFTGQHRATILLNLSHYFIKSNDKKCQEWASIRDPTSHLKFEKLLI